MHLNYWVRIKKQKKFAQPTRKRHEAVLGKKKKVSTVSTFQPMLMPTRLTQFINTFVAKVSTVFQHPDYGWSYKQSDQNK